MGRNITFDTNNHSPEKIELNLQYYFKERYNLDIVYANAAYKIDNFYKCSERLNELQTRKGIVEYFLRQNDI